MNKHRILLQTNPPWLKTGLSENARALLKYLYKTGKYEIAHYCTQVSEADPQLALSPWKSYGALPSDPRSIQELNQDPGKARNAAYGAWNIDKVIQDFKPTIVVNSDDLWAAPKGDYIDKPWWKQINSVLHMTVDSLPILDLAFEQAEHTKYYLTWAKFAQKEMKRFGPKFAHVGQIYGAMDTEQFAPISAEDKAALRQRFGIAPTTVIFNYVFRNQLRKGAPLILDAFAQFKKENPTADVKLHFHTSVSEKGAGWDFPKLIAYYGISPADILFTYVCKHCGQWHVAPYAGEDLKCPYCGTEKSMITVNIVHGVSSQEMKMVYGIADAAFSVMTSGGQELTACQSMLCELPLACTNYSCGEDYCLNPDVFTLGWKPYHEPGTNFIKAATRTEDIKRFISKVYRMPPKDVKDWGRRSRVWAKKTFSIETIGAQWEALFDSMPMVDWDKVNMTPAPKNETFPIPQIDDEDRFIDALYKEILKMNEPAHGEGFRNWKHQLKNGMTRQAVYDFFIGVARDENRKHQAAPQDFGVLLDKTTGRKRALYVIKESNGDCLFSTQLFESFHKEYPNHDLYVATQPKFFQIFDGNPHIFKLLPYMDIMEHEMAMCGAGQSDENSYFHVYFHPGILTQRQLFYLFSETAAFKPNMDL